MFKFLESLKSFISDPSDVNKRDPYGLTPLMWVAINGRRELDGGLGRTLALLAQGANIEATDDKGNTPLLLAGGWGSTKIIPALLAQGANIEATNNDGETPLLRAVGEGHRLDTVLALLDQGANVEATDNNGNTPLLLADEIYNTDTILALLAKGANIEATNNDGETPLMRAAGSLIYKKTLIFQALLDNNADINTKNKKGQTVLDIAAENDNFDIIEILQKHGVDISSVRDIILKQNAQKQETIQTEIEEYESQAHKIKRLIDCYNGSALKSLAESLSTTFEKAQNKTTESPTGTPAVTTVAADLIPPAP